MESDFSEGFVWLDKPDLPPRNVVKIKNLESRRSIFCEALQIEQNFLARYNQRRRPSIQNPRAPQS